MYILSFFRKGKEANSRQRELPTWYLMLLHNKNCLDPCPRYRSLFRFFFRFSQMYHWLRALADPLHFKYQWMQLLALEYSKGLFECVHASCMLPFVEVARLCGKMWMEISVCSCALRVSRCTSRHRGGERERMKIKKNEGREGEIEERNEKRMVREINKGWFSHSLFLMYL